MHYSAYKSDNDMKRHRREIKVFTKLSTKTFTKLVLTAFREPLLTFFSCIHSLFYLCGFSRSGFIYLPIIPVFREAVILTTKITAKTSLIERLIVLVSISLQTSYISSLFLHSKYKLQHFYQTAVYKMLIKFVCLKLKHKTRGTER